MSHLLPIDVLNGAIRVLDQRLVPAEEIFHTLEKIEDFHWAIKDMIVRGAPLIGFTALWGLVKWLEDNPKASYEELAQKGEYLKSARPTAVNLAYEVDRALEMAKQRPNLSEYGSKLAEFTRHEMEKLESDNRKMAKCAQVELEERYGRRPYNIITLCNTGRLACGVLGTALGVISHLAEQGLVEKVYASETRPYLQGTRLTAYELLKENIPHELMVEGAHSFLMKTKKIDAIFIGADRIAGNGDTANKVGSSSLSIVAKHYGVPFYVVAPTSSFDVSLENGTEIPVEMRPEEEILKYKNFQIAPLGTRAFNPSFDITDYSLITAIFCEKGTISPVNKKNLLSVVSL